MNARPHRLPPLPLPTMLVLSVVALGCGCSPSPAPSPAQSTAATQAAADASAAEKLKLYQQMLAAHRDDLAAPIGEDIVTHFGGSPAAAEVRKTLPQIEARAKATAEHDRLANLWTYQTASQSGAIQHTASITSSGSANASVQLILRRHAKWGQSVYLFGSGHGFVCKDLCKLPMHIDGNSQTWKAYLPKTGEPALFINDDARFIKAMAKAKVIEMVVDSRDQGKQTLRFEVGGFDPAKFPPLSKH